MNDPTSDIGEVDPKAAPECDICSDPAIGVDRVTVAWVEDGQAHHRNFCGQDCCDDWDDERPSR